MSTVSQNPTPTCPPTALDARPAPLGPVAPLSAKEQPPRPFKSACCPRSTPRNDYDLGAPFRRAIPCPADPAAAEAAADPRGAVASECGHNPA
jgi:hypothetical protein